VLEQQTSDDPGFKGEKTDGNNPDINKLSG
jgi:hypothetical protein